MTNRQARMGVRQRAEWLCKAIIAKTPLKALCDMFDAKEDDLRMFVKLNVPDMLDQFEDIVRMSKPAVTHRPPSVPTHRRRRRTAFHQAASPQNETRLTVQEQQLADLLSGDLRFSEEDRPFNQLPEEVRDQLREKVDDFMIWREREMLHPRSRL
ncbi:MAG TPA: hypothetical protein VMH91_04210 [Candidatus Paceibacterota bacterium]|nr:hypothetical protein [Candidatus Paceibacterota bacterium]